VAVQIDHVVLWVEDARRALDHACSAMARAELDALAARLAGAGVAHFQDPDGNVLEARHDEPG
jgi:hypothetical protein